MKVIKKPVGRRAFYDDIQNDLLSLQEAVDGRIEAVTLGADCVIVCNEEGICRGLPYNCNVLGTVFVGDILVVGVEGDEFADVQLELEVFNKIAKWDTATAIQHLMRI